MDRNRLNNRRCNHDCTSVKRIMHTFTTNQINKWWLTYSQFVCSRLSITITIGNHFSLLCKFNFSIHAAWWLPAYKLKSGGTPLILRIKNRHPPKVVRKEKSWICWSRQIYNRRDVWNYKSRGGGKILYHSSRMYAVLFREIQHHSTHLSKKLFNFLDVLTLWLEGNTKLEF